MSLIFSRTKMQFIKKFPKTGERISRSAKPHVDMNKSLWNSRWLKMTKKLHGRKVHGPICTKATNKVGAWFCRSCRDGNGWFRGGAPPTPPRIPAHPRFRRGEAGTRQLFASFNFFIFYFFLCFQSFELYYY